ncbi:MAG: Gfo/Idh/MocA family oxidoreductase [Acidobacteria bacterium]|nr:Gfo/Idh/MocA family oxidoreductase [Acidobacteriota bacterium]MCI0620767.1 Gfo/Idh/MocA family oxidoreductase [Acidobacteriota bacterium]MCI0720167.1 Gfo/Idh/MocA family oxidoreductase [Acidobacteriota bacterium]
MTLNLSSASPSLSALVVGGGMITEEVVLPALLQQKRLGNIGNITVVSRRASTIQRLQKIFPDQLMGLPDPATTPSETSHPEGFREAIAQLPKPGIVIVATPDHLHTPVILAAVAAGHHVIVEKPLCLKVGEAHQIWQAAQEKAVYVLTDYHKRHDPAIRGAKYKFGHGDLGQMLHGHAWIEERREIPLKYFANWCEQSSPFEYIGVHYVDAYFFITGLKPRRLIGFGQKKLLPRHDKDAFDAVQAVIEWDDGSVLWVQTAWVCSEHNSALTNQGLQLLGTDGEYWADHKARNCHFVTQKHGYEDYNPNFFKTFDSWDPSEAIDVAGYGYLSIVQGIDDVLHLFRRTAGLAELEAFRKRQELLQSWEPKRALPGQALIGTAVNEAVRLSLANGSKYVGFDENLFPRVL